MRLNADFSRPAVVIREEAEWLRSPESGVDRLMLDRIGDEVARATSIVRYAAGSSFPTHEHAKGEEFLVLEGVFSDESGDYPAGTYVRNPPGSSHAPFSHDGCRILVKLRQFDPADLQHVVIDTTVSGEWVGQTLALHSYATEQVFMRTLSAGDEFSLTADGGLELFVVNGELRYDNAVLRAESWLRVPPSNSSVVVAEADSLLWVKTGHLDHLL